MEHACFSLCRTKTLPRGWFRLLKRGMYPKLNSEVKIFVLMAYNEKSDLDALQPKCVVKKCPRLERGWREE